MKRISIILVALVFACTNTLKAQQDENQKVEVHVEITKDGKKETIVKEYSFPDGEDINWNVDVDTEDDDDRVIVRKFMSEGDSHHTMAFPAGEGEIEKVAYLGVMGYTINADGSGPQSVRIMKVMENTAAHESGLENEDIIKGIDGEDIITYTQLVEVIQSKNPGDEVIIKLNRDGKKLTKKVLLGEREISKEVRFEKVNGHSDSYKIKIELEREKYGVNGEEIELIEKATGVKAADMNTFKSVEMKLFPNPADDEISYELQLKEGGALEVVLLDMNGEMLSIEELADADGEYQGSIALGGYPSGNYLVLFKRGEQIISEKIMKQ